MADADTIISGRPVDSARILRQAAAFSGACHSDFRRGMFVRQEYLLAGACVYVLLSVRASLYMPPLFALPNARV